MQGYTRKALFEKDGLKPVKDIVTWEDLGWQLGQRKWVFGTGQGERLVVTFSQRDTDGVSPLEGKTDRKGPS